MYVIIKKKRWMDKRILWRIHHFMENLVSDRIYKVPYLKNSSAYICPTHSSGITVLFEGVHEPEIVQIIQHFVGQGYAFIDVGANIGLHMIAAGAVHNEGGYPFYAFEPEATSYSLLVKNCQSNQIETARCVNAALGNEVGEKTFYYSVTKNKGMHSLVKRDALVDLGQRVKVLTLDEFFHSGDLEIPKAALVKVDVEGFEYFTLAGGEHVLTSMEEAVIVVELTPKVYAGLGEVSIRKIFDLLAKYGFSRVKVVNQPKSLKAKSKLIGEAVDVVFLKGAALRLFEEFDDSVAVDLEEIGGLKALERSYDTAAH
jgi:FkbM family methyltransferase